MRSWPALLPLALFCVAAASHPAVPAAAGAPPPAPTQFSVPAARLTGAAAAAGERLGSVEALRSFYGGRGGQPAWLGPASPPARVETLVAELRAAEREGLRPADYHLEAIGRLLASSPAGPADAAGAFRRLPPEAARDLELLLSDAFFLYAAHLSVGRVDPRTIEPEWNYGGRARNLVQLLAAALEGDHLATTLAELAPRRQDYRRLRDALAAMRKSAAAGSLPLVPGGPLLRPGDRDARVGALRARLAATGEAPAAAAGDAARLDPGLDQSLRRFQARHGLEPDAVVGPRTLAALNASPAQRVRQLLANLERLRWLPRELGSPRVLVNIPDYRLELTEAGRPLLAMRVIVGQQARRTPFFSGQITSVLLNPPWTVPQRIVLEDKFPEVLEDRDFLTRNGIRVFARSRRSWREVDQAQIDWTKYIDRSFPFQLRQDPGPKNALGRIKFEIPNPYDVYLHDTPTRGLFAPAERAFSSGCIRLERPLDLAERLLAGTQWTRARIEREIAAGKTTRVRLAAPVTVYLQYWTAWVDDDGALQLREDLYGRDAALLEAMALPPGSAAGPR